jgi:hypothetical protein
MMNDSMTNIELALAIVSPLKKKLSLSEWIALEAAIHVVIHDGYYNRVTEHGLTYWTNQWKKRVPDKKELELEEQYKTLKALQDGKN